MRFKKMEKMWKYVIFTYLLFWFLVLGLGGFSVMVLDATPSAMRYVITLCSWAPTIVLLIMLKELKPGLTIKAFYKKAFSEKLKLNIFIIATLLIVGIFLISAYFSSVFEKTTISSQFSFILTALLGNIVFTAVQGASGEESGWRGYLMPEMEKKYGFLKGNLILGVIWALWHLPLWFVSTNYIGMDLLLYIVSFIVGLIAFSIIIGVFMKKCNNLLLAFWMHFLFNFTLTFFAGKDIHLLASLAVLYTISAVIYVTIYFKRNKKSL